MKLKRNDIAASIFHHFFSTFRAKLASWAPLGSLLAASWGLLEASWGILGASWRHLGPSCRILARLGGVLAPSWPSKNFKKNLAWQWNGERVLIHMRLHFANICSIFPHWRTVKILAAWVILAHLSDAVCSEELRFLRKSFQKPFKIISKLSFEHLRRVSETSGKIIRKSFQWWIFDWKMDAN